VFERNGAAAFADYAERVERATRIQVFLLDAKNEEVSGRSVPQGVEELAAQVEESGESEFQRFGRHLLLAHRVSGPSKLHYVIVGRMPDKKFGLFGYEPYSLLMHLATILATAGVVCYWLARYITSPIHKLQAATRRIAGGDLRVRVGAALRSRKDEIADLGGSFDIMAAQIDSLMSAQRRLLRDISHELRSPLARLGVALELARQRAGSEAHGALDRIEREAGRLNELIGQLLVVARLESGAEKTDREPVNIVRLLEEVAADAEFEARTRNCTVRLFLEKKECTVSGTGELLRSAMENIIRNAVHYTDEGSEVEITVQSMLEGTQSFALIKVRDHGSGVPDEALADLFRPFYRVGEARDRKRGGVGLGLTIAERAIQLHGGTVTAANAPDGGLVVTVHLPVREV
jgi:two-component system sensor histidine kinase CpxA